MVYCLCNSDERSRFSLTWLRYLRRKDFVRQRNNLSAFLFKHDYVDTNISSSPFLFIFLLSSTTSEVDNDSSNNINSNNTPA